VDLDVFPYQLPWHDVKKEVSANKLQILVESIRALPCTEGRCKNARPGQGYTRICDRCKTLEQAEAL